MLGGEDMCGLGEYAYEKQGGLREGGEGGGREEERERGREGKASERERGGM